MMATVETNLCRMLTVHAQHVQSCMQSMAASMTLPLGYTAVDLDGRFEMCALVIRTATHHIYVCHNSVRRQESNLGNLVCDVWRLAARADMALLNSGTLRSDRVHPKGQLCMGVRQWFRGGVLRARAMHRDCCAPLCPRICLPSCP